MDLSTFGLVPHVSKTVSPGDVFGRLTILALGKPPGTYRYKAVCRCECGKPDFVARLDGIVDGRVVSCGCYRLEQVTTHGMRKSPLYNVWKNMLARCFDPKNKSFKDYGARGISVCDRWQSVENFVSDMGPTYAPGMELDRRENSDGYHPDNCRWVTHQGNADNRRTGVYLTYNGKTQSLRRWSEETGINYGTLHERIAVWKWDAERALTTPALSKDERMAIARATRWATKCD